MFPPFNQSLGTRNRSLFFSTIHAKSFPSNSFSWTMTLKVNKRKRELIQDLKYVWKGNAPRWIPMYANESGSAFLLSFGLWQNWDPNHDIGPIIGESCPQGLNVLDREVHIFPSMTRIINLWWGNGNSRKVEVLEKVPGCSYENEIAYFLRFSDSESTFSPLSPQKAGFDQRIPFRKSWEAKRTFFVGERTTDQSFQMRWDYFFSLLQRKLISRCKFPLRWLCWVTTPCGAYYTESFI